jgi:hypothetical protein
VPGRLKRPSLISKRIVKDPQEPMAVKPVAGVVAIDALYPITQHQNTIN